jgi:uncharacterized protein DUF1761
MLVLPSVNLLAVPVAALAAFISGGVYWSFIATPFSTLLGAKPEPQASWPALALVAGLITRIIMAYTLAVFLRFAGALSALPGIEIAALACLGILAPLLIGQAAFERRPPARFFVGLVEVLLGFVIMGAILGSWT